MKIKWKRLKKIAEEIAGKPVHISASTLVENMRAGVVDNGKEVEILINLNVIKSLEEVIKAIAHELAHVVLQTDNENKIEKLWSILEQKIVDKYKNI